MWQVLTIVASAAAVGFFIAWRLAREEARTSVVRLKRQADAESAERARQLRQAEVEQQTLFNAMIEGLLVLDADGRVRLANEAFEDLFNLRLNLTGRTLMEAVRLHEVQEVYQRTLVEGQVQGFELELPSLKHRSLRINAAVVMDTDGNRRGMVLVFHDITRIKELEATRREFVANVSHELRTPLSMIKGYVETLIDGAAGNPEVAMKFLHTIEKHADRLTYLIEDLLTLSHLESGQFVINVQQTDLSLSVERVCEDLARKAEEGGVNLVVDVADSILVKADSDRLQQVLFNLTDNAIKYGSGGGDVRIAAQDGRPGMVDVSVVDRGPGIPPEALDRLFERFFRVDKARSREQGGTGLGLAIVKHIVQIHGGEVWVESRIGQGSTFHFSLLKA
jgi:two-component system phosphate regulon sensor histidine kinase PhoR